MKTCFVLLSILVVFLSGSSAQVSTKDEYGTNTSQVLVTSTRHVSPPVTHSLQPSPTATYFLTRMMQRTVFHNTASVSVEVRIATNVSDEIPQCGNSTYHKGDVAFSDDETSPSLITVHEEGQLRLRCSYCAISKHNATLSWCKDGLLIYNDTHRVINERELRVAVVKHSKDEGLYKCVVRSKKQNISRFITVIVKKVEPNPLLFSVSAQNKSNLSVQVTWRLTDHGVFTSALVSLGLRLLDSSNWSHVTSSISLYRGLHIFQHLQPGSIYLLNVTLRNKYKQTESRAVVFWSAATNSSDTDDKALILYQVTNKRALGVALGIIGLLIFVMIVYACVTWCQDDKRGYSLPPGQQKPRRLTDENDALFSTTSSIYYNRAFDDDTDDWITNEVL